MPLLVEKFRTNLRRRFPREQSERILGLCMDAQKLRATPVNEFVDLFV
jgi:2-methylcitrate dehydratase